MAFKTKKARPFLIKKIVYIIYILLLHGSVFYLRTDVYLSTTFSYILHTAIEIIMKLVTGGHCNQN